MNEQDKKIKELLQGYFDEPKPSSDFTQRLMDQIVPEVKGEKPVFEYKPVISKRTWVWIVLAFFVIVYLGLTGSEESSFSTDDYALDRFIDVSIFHSEYILFAALSILALLTLDRLLIRLGFR